MRPFFVAIGIVSGVVGASLASCSSDEFTSSSDAGSDSNVVDATSDAAKDSSVLPCGHTFCDDFESDGGFTPPWTRVLGFPERSVVSDSGVARLGAEAGPAQVALVKHFNAVAKLRCAFDVKMVNAPSDDAGVVQAGLLHIEGTSFGDSGATGYFADLRYLANGPFFYEVLSAPGNPPAVNEGLAVKLFDGKWHRVEITLDSTQAPDQRARVAWDGNQVNKGVSNFPGGISVDLLVQLHSYSACGEGSVVYDNVDCDVN